MGVFLVCAYDTLSGACRAQVASSNHKHGPALWFGHVDHPQIPACPRLAKDNPRALPTGTILARLGQYLLDFAFRDSMLADMRLSSLRLGVEANLN